MEELTYLIPIVPEIWPDCASNNTQVNKRKIKVPQDTFATFGTRVKQMKLLDVISLYSV